MSQEFFDQEIIADFIAEAREHLETIEPNLLQLEKAPDNTSLLNDIFRPMHSLKGASGFLGFNRINRLAHKCENILDELRQGTILVTSSIMDVILSSTDALTQIINNLEESGTEGTVEIDSIIVQIDNLMSGFDGASPSGGGEAAAPAEAAAPEAGAASEVSAAAEAAAPETGAVSEVPAAAEVAAPEAGAASDVPAVAEVMTPEAGGRLPAEAGGVLPEDAGDPGAEGEPAGGKNAGSGAAACAETDTEGVQAGGRLSSSDWIAGLPINEPYTLTTFGEGHLRDFVEEAQETVNDLNQGLLQLEESPADNEELIHDLFRYFHNIKGNSGIISFQELNQLTHEAETLLNTVRKGELTPTHGLVDLLLLVVDFMEVLVGAISLETKAVSAPDVSQLVDLLRDINAGGPIRLPDALQVPSAEEEKHAADADGNPAEPAGSGSVESPADADNGAAGAEPVVAGDGTGNGAAAVNAAGAAEKSGGVVVEICPVTAGEQSDKELFHSTVNQQLEIIRAAIKVLETNSSDQESIDALFRCLTAIKNSCKYFHLKDAEVYAGRTAGIVEQGRKSGVDFSLMLDLLQQEIGILSDMILNARLAEVREDEKAEPPVSAEKDQATPAAAKPSSALKTADSSSPVSAELKTAASSAAPSAPASAVPAAATPKPAAPAVKPVSKPAAKPAVKPAAPGVKSASKPAAKPAAPAADETKGGGAAGTEQHKSSTIRVDHEKLDHLMNLIGELIINRNRYTLIARNLEEGGPSLDVIKVAQSLSETTYAMARISDELQDTIMKVRMVPVSSVFTRFPRLVRDLSRKMGKEIELVMEGEETELDKSVVEVIGDPMVHLIRNAVDHGIEPEDVRLAAGKPRKGTVTLRAFHTGNSVAIEIEDDGGGINPEKMREVALRKGIITPEEAASMDDQEAKELIFAPGFSSAAEITDISGRGVGMDVVRTNIKNLKGSVTTVSEIGKGTKFTLTLPLTLAIIDALMVNVGGETYAIPLDSVSETTKLRSGNLTNINGRNAVTLRGEVLGIVELGGLLGLPVKEELPEVLSVVVIHANERRLGLVVDSLVERQEIVIKSLGAYLGDVRGLSGATIMGDGSVILILDPHEIYKMSTSPAALSA